MNTVEIINKKRVKEELTKEEFNADTIMAYASAIVDNKEVTA